MHRQLLPRLSMMRLVFVYGTLREGGRLHSYMQTTKPYSGTVFARGTMFSLGSFPGAHLDESAEYPVFGEVYEVDKATLDKLDSLEGFYPNQPEISMYVRRRITTYTANADEIEAWAYEYRGSARTPIRHGDWLRFLREEE